MKLNDTHQLLVYVDDSNILRGSVHTIKKKQALYSLVVRRMDQK